VERVHGPGAVEQVPIFITRQVAEPRHRLDLKRHRTDKARRLAASKTVLKTHNGFFVAFALGVRVGPMPKDVSKHAHGLYWARGAAGGSIPSTPLVGAGWVQILPARRFPSRVEAINY